MPKPSHIPVTGLTDYRADTSTSHAPVTLQPVPQTHSTTTSGAHQSTSLPVTGPRKLVRPTLPARSFRNRAFNLHDEPALFAHQNMTSHAATHESSHAEDFYFQKQVQAQTPMMIVLEDGKQINGCIEWYDRNSIKVKGATRMLIYKSAIKYIYKVGEHHA
jgi:sRNA-binding regulator protein Hfq